MFCLLPPTRLALGGLKLERVPDASGLFNLMRNVGGAVGLALIDTVIYGRGPIHSAEIMAQLTAGNAVVAESIGIPTALFAAPSHAATDPAMQAVLAQIIEKAALVQSINEAWILLASLTLLALILIPFAGANGAPTQIPFQATGA